MLVQEPVQAAIWQCLNHYNYSDASFLAERLYAEVGNDEALFLLATCYYRSGKPMRAYSLLKNKGCPTPQCKYLMAKCCQDTNKLSEAEFALCGNHGNMLQKPKSMDELVTDFGETAPFTLTLLARVYGKTERVSKAIECYKRSLKLNSFLWSAYQSLCDMGEHPDPAKVFQTPTTQQISNLCNSPFPPPQPLSTPQPLATQGENSPHETPMCGNVLTSYPGNYNHTPKVNVIPPDNIMDLVSTPDQVGGGGNAPSAPRAPKTLTGSTIRALPVRGLAVSLFSPLSPSFGILPLEMTPSPHHSPSAAFITPPIENCDHKIPKIPKKPMTRRQHQLTAHNRPPPPPVFTSTTNINTPSVRETQGESGTHSQLTRSSRLSASSSSVKENNNKASTKIVPKAPTKKTRLKTGKKTEEMNEINKEKTESENKAPHSVHVQVATMQRQSAEGLMLLLQDMGRAYQSLAHYDCHKAIEQLSQLPPQHYNTGWVLVQIGRAYFEMNDHQKAEKFFQEARQVEPHHMQGMEYYSTALWHLQKEVALSVLAHQMTEHDNMCPQTWCVTGNCFSLNKEHDLSIKFLQRAVQIDPDFAYAYTLLGHEYVLTEELDKALSCFRNALRVDPRHYNAWYGIGMIYYKQEKFNLAEVHYRKARSINPNSSVLLCHIGVVEHALKKSDKALDTLNKALAIEPRNPLCKFHRASILFASDKYKEALKELNELKEIVPRESLVYFLIGKVHKRLGNTHLALMNFSWAMDLDPKGANNNIKEAIDKRYEEDSPGLESEADSSLMEADDVQLHAVESDESL